MTKKEGVKQWVLGLGSLGATGSGQKRGRNDGLGVVVEKKNKGGGVK